MKRARIVLAFVLTLGVIGGAFAFKAKSAFGGATYYVTAIKNANATVTYSSAATTGALLAPTYYYTLVHGQPATLFAHLTTIASE